MSINQEILKKTYIDKIFFLLDKTFAFIVKIINCLEFIRKFSRNVIFINDVSLDNTSCFSMKKSLIS